jgi:hypothetical protein
MSIPQTNAELLFGIGGQSVLQGLAPALERAIEGAGLFRARLYDALEGFAIGLKLVFSFCLFDSSAKLADLLR